MAFPPVRTFIGIPYTATASLLTGASYQDTYWPISQLVDGFAKTSWRCANTTGSVRIDLGSVKTMNYVAIFGHNFDYNLIVGVTTIAVSRGVGVKQPSFWLDMRTLAGAPTSAQFIDIAWANNSRPVTIGEICVGLATEFKGTIVSYPTERVAMPQQRTKLEYGDVVVSSAGSLVRSMDLQLALTTTDRAALDAIHTAAAASPAAWPGTGTRVVVVPSTHRNDAWFVEWPAYLEQTFEESDLVVTVPLTLAEEVFGVK